MKGRRLTGKVSDASGVKTLKVALRSRSHGRCRWWNARTGRLAKRAACKRPRWMKGLLKPAGAGSGPGP